MKRSDLVGRRFTRLRVLAYSHSKEYAYEGRRSAFHAYWKCICDCGKEVTTSSACLNAGHTKSCGCIAKGRVSPNRKAPGFGAGNLLWARYRLSAKNRKLSFNLTREQFFSLIGGDCIYCASPPVPFDNYGKNYGSILANGIDRADPAIGYEFGNCVPCCATCNYAKGLMTEPAFARWILAVADHWAMATSYDKVE